MITLLIFASGFFIMLGLYRMVASFISDNAVLSFSGVLFVILGFGFGLFVLTLDTGKELHETQKFIVDNDCTLTVSKQSESVWYCSDKVTYYFNYSAKILRVEI